MTGRIKGLGRPTPRLDLKAKDLTIPVRESFRVLALDEDTAYARDVTWLLSHGGPLTRERERKRQDGNSLERHRSSSSGPAVVYGCDAAGLSVRWDAAKAPLVQRLL